MVYVVLAIVLERLWNLSHYSLKYQPNKCFIKTMNQQREGHFQQFKLRILLSVFDYNYAGFRLACRSPLCRYAAWSSLAVSELQLSAATPLWLYHRAASLPSWIEFNCLRSAAVGKAARLSIYRQDAACRLVIPLRQVALAQLYKYHHLSGNAASGKLVWKQHKLCLCLSEILHFSPVLFQFHASPIVIVQWTEKSKR